MIVYKNSTKGFQEDVDTNKITELIESAYIQKFRKNVSNSEKNSWTNSLRCMETIVRKSNIPEDCGILIEYTIPASAKRIDFIIAGHDSSKTKNFIIVELKQWQQASSTQKDGIVTTLLGGGERETTHPSYQASSYKFFLKDFNENIYKGDLNPLSCAYLHNYNELEPEPLKAAIYNEVIEDSPLFFKDDHKKLEDFINRYVGSGDGLEILYEIDTGKIRPSKKLVEHVASMFKGNKEFILIDDQKIAYEKAFDIAKNASKKTALIIKGGPGTGKSVISMNLLFGLLKEKRNTIFVAPNAAFREVMVHNLAQTESRTRVNALFKGSSVFYEQNENDFDIIIVDEAHRLKGKGAFMYRGENQIEDILISSKVSIFFVDDDQLIRPDDIGSVNEIKKNAAKHQIDVDEFELQTQFRCSGADGYINWLNNILRIKDTANYDGWDQESFEFKIFDTPNKLKEAIKEKQNLGFKSRLLAGYAWPWTSIKNGNNDGEVDDVIIPEYNFGMPWNSRLSRTKWAIDKNGINQIGCIHTSQGLEFDYVGIIVGNDLRYDIQKNEFFVDWKSYKDTKGKSGLKNKPQKLSKLVRNIYKTLMTRGMKGCYVYFCDESLKEYFNKNHGGY